MGEAVSIRAGEHRGERARAATVAFLLLAAMIAPASVAAQEADLSRCLAIGNIEERVRCYDAIAQAQVQGNGAMPASQAPAGSTSTNSLPAPVSSANPAPAGETPTFGWSAAQREARLNPSARQADELAANVVSARQVGPGYWRFELSNGTVWQLTETRRGFRAPRTGDGIVIRRGALGAFYLDADRQPVIGIRRVD